MFDFTSFPQEPGVYIMRSESKKVLYIGKAKNLRSRIRQYFQEGGDGREMIPHLIAQVVDIDTIVALSEKEALLLENSLIKQHKPKYNVALKDDKTYLSLMINPHEEWPTLRMVRFKGKPQEKGEYFGPYTSGFAARQAHETLLRAFPLRQCSDHELKSRKRPCLLYGMKRCIAPCTNECTREEYDILVNNVISFLKGKDTTLLHELEEKRAKLSEALEFEQAAHIHEQVKSLRRMSDNRRYHQRYNIPDTDVLSIARLPTGEAAVTKMMIRGCHFKESLNFYISQTLQADDDVLTSFILQHYAKTASPAQFFTPYDLHPSLPEILEEMGHLNLKIITPQKGEKKKLIEMATKNAHAYLTSHAAEEQEMEEFLLKLQEACQLTQFPSRIECFDTSHMSLENPVASMAVFIDGKKSPQESRRYKIKHAELSEDYNSMKEALTRRFTRGKKEFNLPNLLILDGGKGQLNLAVKILADLDITGIDIIGFAKEDARHDKGLSQERVFTTTQAEPILLPPKSPLHFFLQKVRDESHKMAIEYHRKRKSKALIKSALDSVEGIGPKKKKALLKHFGSVKRIKEATIEELQEVSGISQKDATNLHNSL